MITPVKHRTRPPVRGILAHICGSTRAEQDERGNVLADIEMAFWHVCALWRTGSLTGEEAHAMQFILLRTHDRIRTDRHRGSAAILEGLTQ